MGEAKAAGAAVLRAPHEAPWGGYVGYFADPDGHPWEVTYAPTLVPQADGSIVLP
ncbi:VOC family protein [Aureimonas populi]